MFAADCATKRAAFMIDMILGRWSHVPALVLQLSKLFVSGCLGKPKVSYDIQVQFRLTISGSDLLGLDFLGSGKAT
jgi:hypothetical protein